VSNQLHVHLASVRDQHRIRELVEASRRSFAAFGLEDLPRLLATGNCMVADYTDTLWAFLCASTSHGGWAYLRGAAIKDGWRVDDGLATVLTPLLDHLRGQAVTHLAVYGTALWLAPSLTRAGFERWEWIVSLERHPRPIAGLPASLVRLRFVGGHDLGALAALDHAVFEPPYQLTSGELVELMVTSGYFMLAEHPETGLVGYACADVIGDTGQIIRLAVHPSARKHGIGRTLLNDALGYCHTSGAYRVTINTQESNMISLSLYEQFGFRRVGRRVPLLVRKVPH
jgi:ribosomal-protein-alanine N-acetyltransferase